METQNLQFETDSTHVKRGFTLIELLIVITIIAILAAILFPVFATARDKARQSACVSNMKQLGLAVVQYETDYDEMTPHGSNNWGYGIGWGGSVYPYVRSKQVYVCPSDVSKSTIISSYGYNSNLEYYTSLNGGTSAVPCPVAENKISAPTRTVMLFEVQGNVTDPVKYVNCDVSTENQTRNQCTPAGIGQSGGCNLNGAGSNATCNNQAGFVQTLFYTYGFPYSPPGMTLSTTYYAGATGRHSNGGNFLMADGHAKWLQGSQVGVGPDIDPAKFALNGGSPANNYYPIAGYCGGNTSASFTGSWSTAPATSCGSPLLAATFAYD